MIWKYWSESNLQNELERIKPGLIDRLSELFEALETSAPFPVHQLFSRSNLAQALSFFTPSNVFNDPAYRLYCLDRLPPQVLKKVSEDLGLPFRGFSENRDAIAEFGWLKANRPKFLNSIGLPQHFAGISEEKLTHYQDISASNKSSKLKFKI